MWPDAELPGSYHVAGDFRGGRRPKLSLNDDGLPYVVVVRATMEEIGGGETRMTIESEFPTVEAMEQLTGGVEEGLMQAVGQIDAILAEDGESAA